ncbi:E3 ubiquitin-protein ligase RNF212B-like [Babylonia areolata]|uniref:E3 ubiquitin-protein ligase RNF212B-like n=1 Tax=Babylonia areolata TaxID=304850 RepID=UPI003FD0FC8D
MADWLHCNICFLQPGKGTPFHITSCGHIYCDRCLLKGSKDKCKMCASKCSTMELSGKMKPDVEVYFQDPMDQLSKAFKRFMQTWEFQRNHRRRFFTHLTAKVLEQNQMLMEAKKMVTSAQALEREAMKLKEENIYLKKLVQEKGIGSGRPSPRSGSASSSFRISPCMSQGMRSFSHSSSRHGSSQSMQHHGGSSTPYPYMSQMTSSATPDRILARTPPSGGRMGTVGNGSPADHLINIHPKTPMSVPHPISFSETPDIMMG